MNKIVVRGKNQFQDSWLSKKEYNSWLEKKNEYTARCELCRKDIRIDNMGETALKSHGSNPVGKHAKLLKEHNDARKCLSVLHFLPSTSAVVSSPASSKVPSGNL